MAGAIFDSILASDKSGAETFDQIRTWRERLDIEQDSGSFAESLDVAEMILMLKG